MDSGLLSVWVAIGQHLQTSVRWEGQVHTPTSLSGWSMHCSLGGADVKTGLGKVKAYSRPAYLWWEHNQPTEALSAQFNYCTKTATGVWVGHRHKELKENRLKNPIKHQFKSSRTLAIFTHFGPAGLRRTLVFKRHRLKGIHNINGGNNLILLLCKTIQTIKSLANAGRVQQMLQGKKNCLL